MATCRDGYLPPEFRVFGAIDSPMPPARERTAPVYPNRLRPAGPEPTARRYGILYIMLLLRSAICLLLYAVACLAQRQNPSPMTEHTREHPRLTEESPPGARFPLATGNLFIPEKLAGTARLPLIVHFHGARWVPEVAAAENEFALISVEGKTGATAYAAQFSDPALFGAMLAEAEQKAGVTFTSVWLTAWSAGHGAIREILAVPDYYDRVDKVLLIDGLHTGYVDGKPGPQESQLESDHMEVFLKFAQDAVAGKKTFLITHSEIFPGTYASTTETADWLLMRLGLHRTAILAWGPMKTQQLSEVRAGGFRMAGFAGNSAPDHVDQFHSLPEFLKWLR